MTFYKDLYLCEALKIDASKMIKKIKQNKKMPDIYLITLATVNGNLLDVIPQWETTQKAYPKDDLSVIGVAKGKKEALNLTQLIIEEVYKATGNFDVLSYISSRWEGMPWM